MEEKNFDIVVVLSIISDFLSNPEDEEKVKAFEDMKRELTVRDYMPIEQKRLLLRKLMVDIKADEILPYTFSMGYEVAFLFDCLLAYVVNIDPDISDTFKDTAYYDLIYVSGLADYILSFCQKDCDRLRNMAERMLAFDNLKGLMDMMGMMTPDAVDKLTAEFKRFTMETNPELLKQYSEILSREDPLTTRVKEAIEDNAFRIAHEVDLNEGKK